MWYLGSFFLFVGCVKYLTASDNPIQTAGMFAIGKVVLALVLGAGFSSLLITGAIVSLIGFGYFWILNRFEGTAAWWLILIGGAVLLI